MAQPVTIPFDQLQSTIRERLKARGAVGIRGLARAFRVMDDNGNRMLDKYEFSKALVEMGINLNKMVHYLPTQWSLRDLLGIYRVNEILR